eukprot:3831663-Pyramimonas_sp.AAC.1
MSPTFLESSRESHPNKHGFLCGFTRTRYAVVQAPANGLTAGQKSEEGEFASSLFCPRRLVTIELGMKGLPGSPSREGAS